MMVHGGKTEERAHGAPAMGPAYALPVSKLRGVPATARAALKRQGINTCARLLERAGTEAGRLALARLSGIDPELLLRLVQRADMARIKGVGAVFSMMLEDLGMRETGMLARQDPIRLHAELRELNGRERLARRSPTPEEVAGWIAQARALERLIQS